MLKKIELVPFILPFFLFTITMFSNTDVRFMYNKFDEASGLSHRSIRVVFEDHNSQIWAAAKYGLNRLEGNRFVEIKPQRDNVKLDNISKIGEDDAGYLWLWNDYTIYFYHTESNEFLLLEERFPDGIPFDPILKKQGSWKVRNNSRIIRSVGGTLLFEDPELKKIHFYNSKKGFHSIEYENKKVRTVLATNPDNSLYFSTDNSIIKADQKGNILEEVFVEENLQIGQFYYKDYRLFFESKSKSYELNKYGKLHKKSFLKDNKLFFDFSSHTFLTLNENGLEIINESGQVVHKIENSPKFSSIFEYVNDFVTDSHGNVWISSDVGISKIKILPNLFKKLVSFQEEKPFNNSVRSILVKNNSLYANLEMGGLVKVNLNDNSKQNFEIIYKTIEEYFTLNPSKSKIDYWGRALASNKENELWIGMRRQLIKIDTLGNLLESYPLFDITNQEDIWSLKFVKDDLWIGTGNGIAYLNSNGTIKNIETNPSSKLLNEAVVLDIVPSSEGLWLCTENGLYLIDPINKLVKESHFTSKTNLLKIQHLYHDKFNSNIYWLASSKGLIKWNRTENSIDIFDESKGFTNRNIYAIKEDLNKHLWLSSDKVIIRFNKENESSRIFTKINGITDNEFNRTSHFKIESGDILFGGMNGITQFHPSDFLDFESSENFNFGIKNCSIESKSEQFNINLNIVNILKEGIFLKGKDLKVCLNLIPKSGYFGNKIQYAYKILESENDWKYTLTNKIVVDSLENGNFTLEIKGRLTDQGWNENNLSIPIYVEGENIISNKYLWTSLFLIAFMGLYILFNNYKKSQGTSRVIPSNEEIKDSSTQAKLKEQKIVKSTQHSKSTQEISTNYSVDNSDWLNRLDKLVIENLDDNRFNVEFIASEMQISRRSLQRKLKEATGKTPKEYFNNIRLDKAKEYLVSGKFRTVKETSSAIGIRNPGYFSEIFKEKFGVAPNDILKK